MQDAPRDGTTVIVLADDMSCARAFMWDIEAARWMQFDADWFDYGVMAIYTYDEELDGYGWVPAPEEIYKKSQGGDG
jgi:hypothetical protein